MSERRLLAVGALQNLIDALVARGYRVLGPTVVDATIDYRPITSAAQLPHGWGDEQDSAHYRLRRRDDDAVFAYACGAQSGKPVFFPADQVLWRSRTEGTGVTVQPGPLAAESGPVAILGIRSCDLAAVMIHDQILQERAAVDAHYQGERAGAFLVAVTCSDPAGTCFCVSMDTGPVPRAGYDLALTELYAHGEHRFVVDVGTERGAELLAELPTEPATELDCTAAEHVGAQAAERMGRSLDTANLKNVIYDTVESAVWDEVGERCLACTNCTLVCPTCFCTSIEDTSDLTGMSGERHRVWDSCFSASYSYIHGGPVRESTSSRYRQWATHKLAAWKDQFGMSGCVGCGRCITWCPAAIDITAEAAKLRQVAEHVSERREHQP